MKIGSYVINVSTGSMPQKAATGFGKVFDGIIGASYTPIAYLGSKLVNGTNYAFLAEQTLITGKDIKSIVLIIINQKPGDADGSTSSIVEIKTLLSNGGPMGGLNISPTTNIPDDAMKVYNEHFGGFLGAKNKPFALLGTQVVHGVTYIFGVESKMVINSNSEKSWLTDNNNTASVLLVKVNSDFSEIETTEVISGVNSENSSGLLGAGAPLGEWP